MCVLFCNWVSYRFTCPNRSLSATAAKGPPYLSAVLCGSVPLTGCQRCHPQPPSQAPTWAAHHYHHRLPLAPSLSACLTLSRAERGAQSWWNVRPAADSWQRVTGEKSGRWKNKNKLSQVASHQLVRRSRRGSKGETGEDVPGGGGGGGS